MRDGQVVARAPTAAFDRDGLVRAMVSVVAPARSESARAGAREGGVRVRVAPEAGKGHALLAHTGEVVGRAGLERQE